MNVGSGYTTQRPVTQGVFAMSMTEIKPMLCGKSHGDPCVCIDCTNVCPFGRRAIELLEKETKGTKIMNKKQIADATKRIEAMKNYVEVMNKPDPVAYIKQKYNISVDRTAKNKIYQWQHNYGTNISVVMHRIDEIQAEIAASQPQMNEEPAEETKAVNSLKVPEKPIEEKKFTKRQEEKMSRDYLEKMRADLENEYLGLEKQIEDYKKGIEECEKKIETIVEKVKSIRAVLDIFKEKDKLYA